MFQIDILLRGEENATTHTSEAIEREPSAWTEADVELVLKEMLRALDRMKHPNRVEREVYLRGISWIVDPFESGGVVIAIEIPTGAAIAGPFDIDQRELERLIGRVLAARPSTDPERHQIH
jgi:hypothetical protein